MVQESLYKRNVRLISSAVVFALSCFGQTHTALPDPIAKLIPDARIRVALEPVASGFVAPTWATSAPGDDRHLYVADQPGQLWEVSLPKHEAELNEEDRRHHRQAEAVAPRKILDVSNVLVKVGLFPPLNYDERGFLSIAFHPRFRHNGLLYTFTSEVTKGRADFTTLPVGTVPNCQTVIREWRAHYLDSEHNSNGLEIEPASRVLLRIDKPQFNHNGGTLAFGPDGLLYISIGDGGAANDVGVGHVSGGNAQNLATTNILGKILRIDPQGHNSANGEYGIPWDNPFARSYAGPPEVWAYGFRNPFRMSFDWETGRLIAGDVGQNNIEEVDVVRKGANYGWPVKEGTFLFDNGAGAPAPKTNLGFVYADSPGKPMELADPIAEYDHADGPPPAPAVRVAVVGGYVYRGNSAKGLRGRYLFGDYSGAIGGPANGHLFTLNGHSVENLQVVDHAPLAMAVLSFGQDEAGELYLLSNATGTVNGKTGQVFRIVGLKGSGN